MESTEQHSLHSELEKLAEGLESKDFPFVGVCATKVLHHLVPAPVKPDPHAFEQEAVATDWVHEANKSIKALEGKDPSLAALCLRKAVKAYPAGPAAQAELLGEPGALEKVFERLSSAVGSQEYSSAADAVRAIGDLLGR